MTMTLFLWGSIFWIAPLVCWTMLNETKFKKNLVLGVTMPQSARTDEDVAAEIQRFKHQSRLICLGLLVVILPCLFIQNFTIQMFLWGLWVDACVIIPNIPYVRSHGRLMKLKAQKGWVQEKKELVINTAVITAPRWLSPWLFLPPVLLSLLPALFHPELLVICLIYAATCLSFWFCYRYLYRNKAEMVDGNVELTKALTQIRRHQWGKLWLITAYLTVLLSLCSLISMPSVNFELIAILAISLLLGGASVAIELKTRKLQEQLTKDSGGDWYVDDDDKWIGGILYYNPNDRKIIINSRIGAGSTVNLARTPGKLILLFTALCLLVTPLVGVFLDKMGKQDITIAVTGQQLEATAGSTDYKIDLQDIQELTLLEELPDHLSRVNGTGMETLLKGYFTSDLTGSVQVMLDPTSPPFLLVKNSKGRYFLLGSRDSAVIPQIYEEAQTYLP